MTEAEFEQAVEQIRQGNKNGLRVIYEAYGDKIYRLFLGKVRKREDAEDLTSDFFLKLWETAPLHQSGKGHRAWMGTIARNMAIDYLRHAGHETPVEDADLTNQESLTERTTAEDTVISDMNAADILSQLSEDEQEIVRMHLAAELTFREIASILKRPLGTVAWKYQNAIGKLKRLAEEGKLV